MDNYIYLPSQKNKAYTPLGILSLFKDAEKENEGNVDQIFKNKHKYKELIELWHGGFLALALHKWLGNKFSLVPSDSPDIFFIDNQTNGAFRVEVMELYEFRQEQFDDDYEKLVKNIWNIKGNKAYSKSHLLLASRLISKTFNITKFVTELQKYTWNFERIWLSLHTQSENQWTFFEVFPFAEFNDTNKIFFNLNNDKKYFY